MRLAKLIHWFHADGRPKQFATLIGSRSMLQHTCQRALGVSPSEKILVMITAGQERWAYQQLPNVRVGNFMVQSMDMGTGAAISMAIARVMAVDPGATVAVYPSDHFVHPEEKFSAGISRAFDMIETSGDGRILLLGAKPTAEMMGMGWIIPGEDVGRYEGLSLHGVAGFTEKPSAAVARQLRESGAVWNTFVMMGKAETFGHLLRKEQHSAALRMDRYAREWREGADSSWTAGMFHDMPPFDFSIEVLQPNVGHLSLLLLDGVHWHGWGTPESFFRSIEEMGWSDRLDEKIVASEFAELQPN